MALSFSISELRNIADQLTELVGIPFNKMAHSFLKRRLNEVFERLGFRKVEQLTEAIKNNDIADDLRYSFSVSTTELFRDPSMWRSLRKLISCNYINKPLNIWLPDVASGEELYSLFILLEEIKMAGNTHIVVNHTSKKAIENIKQGLLAVKNKEVNSYNIKRYEGKGDLEDYFFEDRTGYKIKSELIKNVTFRQGGILDIPDTKVDIILFRNVMLSFTRKYHLDIKNRFDEVLKPGGIICIGVKEVLPSHYNDRFECFDEKEKIYRKYSFLKS